MKAIAHNLQTGERRSYLAETMTPKRAVVCARRQELGDWNTWGYEAFEAEVTETEHGFVYGDWWAPKGESHGQKENA